MIIKSGEFDLRGYEIVRTQFFASAGMTSVSFSKNGVRFSSACIRGFSKIEYIRMQVHPFAHAIAVFPCSEHDKNKMCWARVCADAISTRTISGKAFLNTLYELFGWDMDKRYRLRGEIMHKGKETMALFNVAEPEIYITRYDMTMPWVNGFGDNYYAYREARMLKFGEAAASEYDSTPELHPTAKEEADEKIRSLIEKMQKDGRNLNDSKDILN